MSKKTKLKSKKYECASCGKKIMENEMAQWTEQVSTGIRDGCVCEECYAKGYYVEWCYNHIALKKKI